MSWLLLRNQLLLENKIIINPGYLILLPENLKKNTQMARRPSKPGQSDPLRRDPSSGRSVRSLGGSHVQLEGEDPWARGLRLQTLAVSLQECHHLPVSP